VDTATNIPIDVPHNARSFIARTLVQRPGQLASPWPIGCDGAGVMERNGMQNSKAYDVNTRRLAVLARGDRERERTGSRNTVATFSRWWVIVLGAALAACGGGDGKRADMYARASHAQEACCEHLTGAPRDQCLRSLVTVDDPMVASTPTNQDTYACVSEHFVCDPATGHATQASAQSQLDCIQDLGE
jgi:hypothetical protein